MDIEPGDEADAVALVQALTERSVELHAVGDYDAADEYLARAQELAPPCHVAPVEPYEFERGASARFNLVNYARRQPPGNRQVFASYYTLQLPDGTLIPGQRSPHDRLRYLPDDLFADRNVLDVGCNFGGMIHVLSCRHGIGVDCDPRLVNAANCIAMWQGLSSRRFFVHDLEEDPLDLMLDFMPEKIHVILLLSVCAHINNWREVIAWCGAHADAMVFEANGHEHEQLGQLRALWHAYGEVVEVAGRGAPGIGARRLYLCQEPK